MPPPGIGMIENRHTQWERIHPRKRYYNRQISIVEIPFSRMNSLPHSSTDQLLIDRMLA